MTFDWHPDEPPPQIEEHSKAKLEVLRRYIRAYFDRLNVNTRRDIFKLDLVDGFAGGGSFLEKGEEISGTPLVMLEETEAAKARLNKKRKKPLHIDCKYYFIEKKKAHTDHLLKVLNTRGYSVDNDEIVIRNASFKNEVEKIINSIKQRQPRAGRAIFLLDQTGWKQVDLLMVARIFRELPAAEVILTFAADALVNFLTESPHIIRMTATFHLSESQINTLIQDKEQKSRRALVQRSLRTHVRNITGATFDTPFFIRPRQSRRALWFLHLSKHPTARNVMIQLHWDIQNTFEHYGRSDFGMLGWDAIKDPKDVPLFGFGELDQSTMKTELLNSIPRELFSLVLENPVTVDALRHIWGNKTPARFSDFDQILIELMQEGEFQIWDSTGKKRSKAVKKLNPMDSVTLPSTLLFPSLSRRS